MSINILKRSLLIISLVGSGLFAQDKVDAIEAARQAKAAAEKAAADAEAATDAAIEQAAKNAAQGARDKIKQAKIDEEARKVAEAAAAEEAELDAAANAAAEEAKKRMAEELGLEYVPEGSDDVVVEDSTDVSLVEEPLEEVILKEKSGFDIGFTGSVGFINGAYITNTPIGGSLVLKTPYGYTVGENLKLNLSLAAGAYTGEGNGEALNASFIGIGANATIFEFVFSETHAGFIGAGIGIRNFNGITLEKILNKGFNLPVNILVGLESFLATKADDVAKNSTYWSGLGLRIDYSF
jgi:hypothetical protein